MGGNVFIDGKEIRGYKVFNSNWVCEGVRFEVGKIYRQIEGSKRSETGFEFYLKAIDCFNSCRFDPKNKVAEILALGMRDSEDSDASYVTDEIRIVREMDWGEVLEVVRLDADYRGKEYDVSREVGDIHVSDVHIREGDNLESYYDNLGFHNVGVGNVGDRNLGGGNVGDRNIGSGNSDNFNRGNKNSGEGNIGDYNSGCRNRGSCNSGNYNCGSRNSGNYNLGHRNTGDWNVGDYNSGYFNSNDSTIRLFNKQTDWTFDDWMDCEAREILNDIPYEEIFWVCEEDMSEEEKRDNPEFCITGGFLREGSIKSSRQEWWDSLETRQRLIVRSLPNFDSDVFREVTGIDT